MFWATVARANPCTPLPGSVLRLPCPRSPVAPRHPRRHQPARGARSAARHAPRHRTALRRRQGPRRRVHADLRGRARRQPTDLAAGPGSCSSSRSTAAGTALCGDEERRAPGRRAPEGPADRGPVQGAHRDHEREAREPARGSPLLAAGSRCGSTGRRTPWRASMGWLRRSGTTWGGCRHSSVVESAGERWHDDRGSGAGGRVVGGRNGRSTLRRSACSATGSSSAKSSR